MPLEQTTPSRSLAVAERACSASMYGISRSWLGAHDMTKETRSPSPKLKSAQVSPSSTDRGTARG